jgi:hypothetical protein
MTKLRNFIKKLSIGYAEKPVASFASNSANIWGGNGQHIGGTLCMKLFNQF